MYGDIDLTLPADAQGRLDAATRKGDLRSDVPLVRVARPGPESHGGGRMVGALGSAESARAQIDLVTQHGDISIHLGPASRRTPVPDSQPAEAASSSGPAVQPEGVEGEAYPTADVQNVETNPATTENNHPVEVQAAVEPRTEDPALAILQALEDGLINVEEADRMLQELPRAGQ